VASRRQIKTRLLTPFPLPQQGDYLADRAMALRQSGFYDDTRKLKNPNHYSTNNKTF
jgi:hypothetical protein